MLAPLVLALALPVWAPSMAPASDTTLEAALDAIEVRRIEADIRFLASDELAGRDTPSDELRVAARFIRSRLLRLDFEPAGDNGFFDEYELESKRLDIEQTSLVFSSDDGPVELSFGEDYTFSEREIADHELEGPLIFVGTGTAAEVAGLDLSDSWAVARDSDLPWRKRRENVRGTGAMGLVVLRADAEAEPFTRRFRSWAWRARSGGLSLSDAAPDAPHFPQVYLNRAQAAGIGGSDPAPGASLDTTLHSRRVTAEGNELFTVENVCGLWPGSDPELAQEVLIVSAHYDHVGTRDGEIYNGADDNASGSTGLLAVAESLAAYGPLRRSVLLLWVSGEEKGLLGSKAWTLDPTLEPGQRPVANINIDMIGRNAPDSLLVTPTEALPQYNDLVVMAQANCALEGFAELGNCDDYWARSDQKSFSDNLGIPVMFLFSDIHADYHQPTDTPDKIDYDKIRRVARLVVRMLAGLQGDAPPAGLREADEAGGDR